MVKLIIGRPPKCDPMGLAGNERIAMKSDCLRQVYLHSNDARLAATELARRLAATELARRAMKQHRHLPKTLVRLIASGLDPWVGTTEEVRVNYLPKGSDPDDSRIMLDFGPENRAPRLLRAIADVHPHQFGTAYIARSPAAPGGSNLKRPASWRSDGGSTPADARCRMALEGSPMTTPGDHRTERWLTAILAADVAGYSRLVGADEVRTARVLREHRAGLAPSPGEVMG